MGSEQDNATKILLAIQEADTVLLRNFYNNNTQTYHLHPKQSVDEEIDELYFTDDEYGTDIVTRTQLAEAIIVGHEARLPPKPDVNARTILCYSWHPHQIDS